MFEVVGAFVWCVVVEQLSDCRADILYRVATQLFNGYGQFVADLYRGLETERLFM